MKRKTDELIEQGLKIRDEEKETRIIDGWWAKYKEKRKVKGMFNSYKNAV